MTAELTPKPESNISPEMFEEILPEICDSETSLDVDGWTKENPLYGHCAVVSVIAQELFGGSLLRADMTKYPKWAKMRSHYVNLLPSGEVKDFTLTQFKGERPKDLEFTPRERVYVLSYPETAKRYDLLLQRLNSVINKR